MNNPDTNSLQQQQLVNRLQHAIDLAGKVILGKESVIRLTIACLLARGHLLLEDLPGVGKTTLALTLAHIFGLDYKRIQFTSDLLPADVLGVSIYNPGEKTFSFHKGPVFCQVLLADEINRAPPKTQSALLEAMEEKQISNEGNTYKLPAPFFVIATQNPEDQAGTFRLPESQLDRFLIRTHIGYPDHTAEKNLLQGTDRKSAINTFDSVFKPEELLTLQSMVDNIHLSESVSEYIVNLMNATRHNGYFIHGLSPRAGMAVKQAAQSWALLHKRDYILPEDIQEILIPVTAHRLTPATAYNNLTSHQLLQTLLKEIPV